MITFFEILIGTLAISIILLFSLIGYFSLGFLITMAINKSNSLSDYFLEKYIKYLIKKYPDIYYEDNGRYWIRRNEYQSNGIMDDKKVKKFDIRISMLCFILWPIDILYIFINKTFKK